MGELFQFKRNQRPADPMWNTAQFIIEFLVLAGLFIAAPGLLLALMALLLWSWICGDL